MSQQTTKYPHPYSVNVRRVEVTKYETWTRGEYHYEVEAIGFKNEYDVVYQRDFASEDRMKPVLEQLLKDRIPV